MSRASLPLTSWLLIYSLFPCIARGEEIQFARDIFPIFQKHCISCHGPDAAEGQLRLDARVAFLEGGVSGALLPSKSDKSKSTSLLLQRVRGQGGEDRMPLDADPLSKTEFQKLTAWIGKGAPWPEGVGAKVRSKERHWAYDAPRSPSPPADTGGWSTHPVDRFVLRRLKERQLQPQRRAEPAKLLRRVYLDLVGYSPSVEQIEAFERNPSQANYERIVERLLSSPAYGEKWARRWLDLARYADSNGYQADQYRNVWPYRDWVVGAINRDMPFDQFTIEQLAGDLLPNATLDQRIATGFYRLTTCNVEAGVDPESNRIDQVIDRVNTTGTVWLGTTLECCQCHNHKYDPFTQQDYYQIFAFLNNTPMEVEGNGVTYNFTGPKMPLPLSSEKQNQRRVLENDRESLVKRQEEYRSQNRTKFLAWLKDTKQSQASGETWHPAQVTEFVSAGGADHRVLDDHSVLVSGKKPDKDTYKLVLSSKLNKVTAIRLEALTDPSLPGKGPGRFSAERPNFVLHELRLKHLSATGQASLLKLKNASADFAQKNFPAAHAIDGKPKTGWAINPQFHKPHAATFELTKPLELADGDRLEVELIQNHGGGRTLGRPRISLTSDKVQSNSLPPAIAALLAKKKHNKAQEKKLEDHFFAKDPKIKELQNRIKAVDKKLEVIKPITTLVMIESKPRMSSVLKRGDFKNPGDAVKPGTPKRLHPFSGGLPPNRLGFARWLVDPANPLVARVVVNRWWAEIFGAGLVTTQEDFGTQGERPSHPELLDYLAVEFSRNLGWSRKALHRLIVTSQTYQQSSRVDRHRLAKDPVNRWFSRGPRVRLSAELIRDNALSICGLLTHKVGGPPVFPPQPAGIWRHVGRNAPVYDTSKGEDRFRRGIYTIWRRSAPYASFTNFDAPDRASCVVARGRTNTPLQALTLLNDGAYAEMGRHLAAKLHRMAVVEGTNDALAWAFRRCVARKPTDREIHILRTAFNEALNKYKSKPDVAAKISRVTNAKDAVTLAAWFHIANILLNLDETITKG